MKLDSFLRTSRTVLATGSARIFLHRRTYLLGFAHSKVIVNVLQCVDLQVPGARARS